MSEFSESYHLRSNDIADAVALLRATRSSGFVFPASKGWVSFVTPRGSGPGGSERYHRLAAANRGVLLDYGYAEDHGCSVQVFRGASPVAKLEVSFETSSECFERASFLELGLLTQVAANGIDDWIRGTRDPGMLVVAAGLGLPRHQWFSYEYEMRRQPADAEGRITVTNGEIDAAHEDEDEDEAVDVEGPVFRWMGALVDEMTSTGLLLLLGTKARGAVIASLVEALDAFDGASPEAVVLECLAEHEQVDEVFAEEADVRRVLSRIEGSSKR